MDATEERAKALQANTITMVVCSYGHLGTRNRTPREIVGYGMYLDNCWKAAMNLSHHGYRVNLISCGGAVDENGDIEAETMVKYFQGRWEQTVKLTMVYGKLIFGTYADPMNIQINCENRSLTTPANLAQAKFLIGIWLGGKILVCCDKAREYKVRWLVKKLYADLPNTEVVAFERPDITFKSTKLFQFLETMALAIIPKLLQKRISEIRKKGMCDAKD